jgi:hypothetical protein
MPGSLLRRSWESSSISIHARAADVDATEKADGRTAVSDVEEQSDAHIVPMKPSNNRSERAETVEGRRAANGNDLQLTANRTQCRAFASRGS